MAQSNDNATRIIFRTSKAACPECGGWTTFGGMSQRAECLNPRVCAERRLQWLEQGSEGDPYRAAVWTSPDGQREMALTTREQSHLSDDDLLAADCEWAEANDLTCCTDEISVQSFA